MCSSAEYFQDETKTRRSWIIEKRNDGYHFWYKAVPIEGGGYGGEVGKQYLRDKAPYFVVYEGRNVPHTLCECAAQRVRFSGLKRFSHEYNWGDVPWIELIAWGA